ncbi:DNA-directed RNA polymerases I and III subunit RPAC2-like [Halichondria panicea]|uniref:DNA-directed RNA polymerases I and III subunit RPAC2-like n=1 Tax=Halichondria panicea TaxID=6063 RepID=UPI00312B9536
MAEDRERCLEIVPLDDPDDTTCMTFVLKQEDHTLGNALRYMIMKNPDVTFCGYSVPHPSEPKINLRVQTNGVAATDALRKGLEDLQELCAHVQHNFEQKVASFSEQDNSMSSQTEP